MAFFFISSCAVLFFAQFTCNRAVFAFHFRMRPSSPMIKFFFFRASVFQSSFFHYFLRVCEPSLHFAALVCTSYIVVIFSSSIFIKLQRFFRRNSSTAQFFFVSYRHFIYTRKKTDLCQHSDDGVECSVESLFARPMFLLYTSSILLLLCIKNGFNIVFVCCVCT